MKTRFVAVGIAGLAACAGGNHAATQSHEGDVASIQAVVRRLETAWTTGNGEAWGREFADDADFTVWFGMRVKGREAIALSHQRIFDTIYKNTRVEMHIAGIHFITADVALVDIDAWVTNKGEERGAQDAEVHPLIVMARSDTGWAIEAFQNTPNYGPTRIVNGDIRLQPEFAGQ